MEIDISVSNCLPLFSFLSQRLLGLYSNLCYSHRLYHPQLQTFNTAAPCTTVEELTTGDAISQALHQIDPAWFSESWLGHIKEDVGNNWRLKMKNLKKILQMMVDYYNEVLSQQIQEFPLPDLVKVAEHSDPIELGRLLQLTLGCAVKCERKQEYIQIIMTLEESVQHVVMTALQEVRLSLTRLKKAVEDLADLIAEKEELAQRCQELDVQVTVLQEERNGLLAENDVLTDRANQLDSFDDPSTPSGRKHSQLQIQLETLQEENFRLEAAKDDYRIHCEELEKQLIEVQHRNDELTSLAEESRALKDELDILRSCSDHAVKLEASVETYRRKLEDLGDLRRQVKLLEEKNMTYMHNTVSLEEELRKANTARMAGMPAGSPTHDNLAAEILPVEYREKFIRLQHENKMLRVQQEGSENDKISELQTLLEVAHRTCSELDTDNRLSRVRVTELQQQVEDLQKALQGQGAKTDDSHLKRKLDAHMVQLNEAQDEIMKKKELLEDLQPDNTQTSLRLDELMAALKKKDDDMRAMEERYKMYLEKARNVICALDPKLNPATAEIQALKNQLTDRDKRILSLERECEQAKLREYEEKLVVTAWYNKVRTCSQNRHVVFSFENKGQECTFYKCYLYRAFVPTQLNIPVACLPPPSESELPEAGDRGPSRGSLHLHGAPRSVLPDPAAPGHQRCPQEPLCQRACHHH
uniref:Calponin-homology (CH) domain-containing protein n=1 Tax=Oncorhynchus mykiss TaxID=8022 RepID=A0A8C7T1X6_ONCMY